MSEADNSADIAGLTVQLLSAYLANNTVASADLADLIRTTRAALTEEAATAPAEDPAPTYTPAVSVKKSLSSPDHLLSLVDGKPYKTLKRHLATHGLTPETYRERYGLPASYPMVAPTFAARRREIAEQIGLGNRRKGTAAPVPAPVEAPASDAAPAKTATKAAPAKKVAAKSAAKPRKTAAKATAPAPEPAASPAPEKPKPAARKSSTKAAKPAVETPKADGTATESTATTPKAPRAKRMARTPKPA